MGRGMRSTTLFRKIKLAGKKKGKKLTVGEKTRKKNGICSSYQPAWFFRVFPSLPDFFQAYLTQTVWKIMGLSEIARRHEYPLILGSKVLLPSTQVI